MADSTGFAVGLMSGTSLDGTDAALIKVGANGSFELRGFKHQKWSQAQRVRVERVLSGGPVAELARLDVDLAAWSGELISQLLDEYQVAAAQLQFIAFPGLTLWHEPQIVSFQVGSSAVLAERFSVPVVHDFRSRDIAAGGQGAPLVPLIDALHFSSVESSRLLLNIGGMANVTWVPPGGDLDQVLAGDSGPGMAVIDEMARMVDPDLPYDSGGQIASTGRAEMGVVTQLLEQDFFKQEPPRSTGREFFGTGYAKELWRMVPGPDGVRTAVELTARSISDFCVDYLPAAPQLIASGGGVLNPVLMNRIAELLRPAGTEVEYFEDLYFNQEAKEAVAFGLLGARTMARLPGNLPSVTGASGPRILGSICWPQ